MMPPKKPSGLAIIVGAKPEPEGDEGGLDAAKVGERAAARSLLSAIKANDLEGVQSALHNYLVACGAMDGAEPDADDEKADEEKY